METFFRGMKVIHYGTENDSSTLRNPYFKSVPLQECTHRGTLPLGSSLSLASPPNRQHLLPWRVKLCPRRGHGGKAFFGGRGFSFFHSQRLAYKDHEAEAQHFYGLWNVHVLLLMTERCNLQLVETVAVLSKLHHSSKHQDACAFTHKTVCGTARGDVPSHCGKKPLSGN